MDVLLKPRRTGLLGIVATALAIGLAVAPSASLAGDMPGIGPLPAKKAPKASMVEFGKRLFFDARLSGDGALSCASCHDPKTGFTTRKPLSDAYPGTKHWRNAPTLINTIYKADFKNAGWSWDGHMGADLNDVVRNEITETIVLNLDMRLMHERMKQDPVYVKMCKENFNGECSSGKGRKALVAFMQTLVSKDAPFDTGQSSEAANRGRGLFEGKAGCISCHNGPYFSDGEPHNTGVPENMEVFKDPMRHMTYVAGVGNHGTPNMDNWRRDVGYFMVSRNYADVGKFITPTLRELKYTAPYMHNGTMSTLAEIVEFYNVGGGKDDPLATELKPLGLSDSEKSDLVAFLESLSSATPVTVEKIKIPQKYEAIANWLDVKN